VMTLSVFLRIAGVIFILIELKLLNTGLSNLLLYKFKSYMEVHALSDFEQSAAG